MKNKYLQNGRSMIEMLGVLSIVGILTVGGFSLVMKAQTHQKINEVTDNLTTLARKVRVVARDYTGSAGNINSYINTGRAYPDTMELGDGGFIDRNDIAYNVQYVSESGKILFVIGVSGLSPEMCMNMVNANYGNKSSSGFVGMSVGDDNIGNAVDAISGGTADNVALAPNTIKLDVAATKCVDNVAMYFAFR